MTDAGAGPIVVVYTGGGVAPIEIAADAGDRELLFAAPTRDLDPELYATLEMIGAVVDVVDEEAGLATLKAARPGGIVAFSDHDLPLAARLAARLGLRYHSEDAVLGAVDKVVQRERLRAAGLRVPRFREVSSVGRLAGALAEVGTPAVLKPTRGAGSRDTYRVDDLAEALDHAGEALRTGRVGTFVLEEMLVGSPDITGPGLDDAVSADQLWWDGEPVCSMIGGRLPLRPPFRETGYVFPGRLDPAVAEEVFAVASAGCRALGLADGWTHTEIILTPDGPVVIEVNARIGAYRAVMMHRACGLEAVGLALDVAAGVPPEVVPEPAGGGAAYTYQIFPPVGAYRLAGWGTFAQVERHPSVLSVVLSGEAGERVDWRGGTAGILGVVEGVASGPDEALAAIREIERRAAQDIVYRSA